MSLDTTISETEYKADLEVLDRYQAYSAEVARLAILTIIGFGFLLSFAFYQGGRTQFGDALLRHKYVLTTGILALGIAVGLALAHRYVSTDSMSVLIRNIRIYKSGGIFKPDYVRDQAAQLFRRFRLSGWLIAAASIFLVVGVVCIALAALAALAA
ncbi:MAG: hypothetical protein QOH41_1528 [Blastocatellia bacterium]|jgi:hypothetical protein|nr:hypothetical protein [Blastocatellia bacterium]